MNGRIVFANSRFEEIVSDLIGEPAGLVAGRRSIQELADKITARVVDPETITITRGVEKVDCPRQHLT